MAESKAPIICVTCKRPLPEDVNAQHSPRYFAQAPLLPRSDDAGDFITEARQLTEYIKAISEVMLFGDLKHVEKHTTDTLTQLVMELSAEAIRRQDLALDATNENWNRTHTEDASTPAKGRA